MGYAVVRGAVRGAVAGVSPLWLAAGGRRVSLRAGRSSGLPHFTHHDRPGL